MCTISYYPPVGFPTQMVDPITDKGISTAGFSGYTLICYCNKEPDLPPTSTLMVQWLDLSGGTVADGGNFTISGSGPSTDIVLTSRLTFNSLYTSQAGQYTCKTLLTIPDIVTNHPMSVTFTVAVKCEYKEYAYNYSWSKKASCFLKCTINYYCVRYSVPAPLPLTFHHSRHSTLKAGTIFSLSCHISTNTTGVNTDFSVQSDIAGPGTSDTDRVSISQLMPVEGGVFESVMIFRPFFESDSGSYNCSVRLASSQNNVMTSESISAAESIDVERKF